MLIFRLLVWAETSLRLLSIFKQSERKRGDAQDMAISYPALLPFSGEHRIRNIVECSRGSFKISADGGTSLCGSSRASLDLVWVIADFE